MKNAGWFMCISKMNVRSLKLLVVVLGLVFGAFIVVDNFVSCDYESQKVIPNRSNSKILVQYSLEEKGKKRGRYPLERKGDVTL